MKIRSALSRLFLIIAFFILILGTKPQGISSSTSLERQGNTNIAHEKIIEAYDKLPMSFELNQGQTQNRVEFLAHGAGYGLLLTGQEAVFNLSTPHLGALKTDSILVSFISKFINTTATLFDRATIQIQLLGTNPDAQVVGENELPGKINYYLGNRPEKWQTNIPSYGKVMYRNVYPGVDLAYYGNQKQLEYDFIVAPGADTQNISFAINGMNALALDKQGDLLIKTLTSQIRMDKPAIYQEEKGGRNYISGGYIIKNKNQIAFELGTYNTSKLLIIDPVLVYSTYFGGTDFDIGVGITVDSSGAAYVMGLTSSPDLLNSSGLNNNTHVFVTKITPDGKSFVYKTYIGGSGFENTSTIISGGICVDASGDVFVSGSTTSTDFPTNGPFKDPSKTLAGSYLKGTSNAYVVKLNALGQFDDTTTYSRFLGGSGWDDAGRIAVDNQDNVYLTGHTNSTDFPISQYAYQANYSGANDGPGLGFMGDGFVAKLDSNGGIVYSTYLSGSNDDTGIGIAIDNSNNIYVTGWTSSPDFPVTQNAYQGKFGGAGPDFKSDGFVTKFNVDPIMGYKVAYSTYLGGTGDDFGMGIAVDSNGYVFVTGGASENFPITLQWALQPTYGGNVDENILGDAFITVLDPNGGMVYSTYLGGVGCDAGTGIAVDNQGNAFLTGFTFSNNFPTLNTLQQQPLAWIPMSAFVASISVNLKSNAPMILNYSTYLGTLNSGGVDIAIDSNDNAYVTGVASENFPVINPAQSTYGGNNDAFVTKLSPANQTTTGQPVLPIDNATGQTPATLTFSSVTSPGTTNLSMSSTGPAPQSGFTFGSTPTYYDISTTAQYSGPITVCFTYDPTKYNSMNNLKLLHYENGSWTDVTTSNDTIKHILCGSVNSLSPFVIAQLVIPISKPSITFQSLTPPYNSIGWNNTDVTVTWTCTNSLTNSVSVIVNTEGKNLSATGTCTDSAKNTASATQTGIKIDKTPPTIMVNATTSDGKAYAAGTWTNKSVAVHYTCSDALSGIASCPSDQVFSSDGTYSASGTAMDNADNQASSSFGPIQIDKISPTLNPKFSDSPIYLNEVVTITPNANDTGSGIASSNCATVDTSSVGSKTLACTATDNVGNTITVSVPYQVIYRFDGFLQPVNDTAHSQTCGSPCPTSIFKGGSTVPIKFLLKDFFGNLVQSKAAPSWVIPLMGGPTSSPIDEDVYTDQASNGSTYSWDGQQYHYNWSTKGLNIGYFWRIGVSLDDGQTYYVYIGLK